MKGEKIGSIYAEAFGYIDVVRGEYSEGGRTAIWLYDPLNEYLMSFVTINAPNIYLEADEILVQPRKGIRKMMEALLSIGSLEDTGQRIRVGFRQVQIWRLKNGQAESGTGMQGAAQPRGGDVGRDRPV